MKSKFAASLAVEMGYQNVFWYKDGLKGWKKAGYPTSYTIKMLQDPPKPIGPAVLKTMLDSKDTIFLVDIRDNTSKQKFGFIKGRTLDYPMYRLHSLYYEMPKTKQLVIYDIRGKQAPTAARYLLYQGYPSRNVTYLDGGIDAWKKAGFHIER